jgi:hypothetical protein
MVCLKQKIGLGISMAGIGASGVTVVAGAPTVVGSGAGVAGAVISFGAAIYSLFDLEQCYRDHGRITAAEKVVDVITKLKAQMADLLTKVPDALAARVRRRFPLIFE